MKNGVCPKCLETQVYYHPGSRWVHGEVMALNAGAWAPASTLPDKYVCARCGYLEYYIPKVEELDYIQQKWQHVPAQ